MTEKQDNKQTLVNLTRGFISMLQESNGSEVELVTAEKALGASKRRLYDVTNVLAGIGLIERCGKSKVRWVGQPTVIDDNSINNILMEREREIDRLTQTVDEQLKDLSQSELFREKAWVSEEDIRKLDPDGSTTLFALQGPQSMTIQIVDQESGTHHMICKTDDGQIIMTPINKQ